jgi:isopentenyldiphosphate isomerase
LISQRSHLKEKAPLKWECNGGALLAGENVIDGLVREIYEELGISLPQDKAIFLKTAKNNHRFKEIYLFEMDIEIDQLKFVDGEVSSAKWVNIEEFMNMFNNGDIVHNVDFDESDYEKCLSLLALNDGE